MSRVCKRYTPTLHVWHRSQQNFRRVSHACNCYTLSMKVVSSWMLFNSVSSSIKTKEPKCLLVIFDRGIEVHKEGAMIRYIFTCIHLWELNVAGKKMSGKRDKECFSVSQLCKECLKRVSITRLALQQT